VIFTSTASLLLFVIFDSALAIASGGVLSKALSETARPVVVHLWDPRPADLASWAIDEVSWACRQSGAAAVLVGTELLDGVVEEQESHRGDYPGPLPVVADCYLRDLVGEAAADVSAAFRKRGAAAVGIRYHEGDWDGADALEEALQGAVDAAEQSGLSAILLAEFGADGAEGAAGADELASRVGAAAALDVVGASEGDEAGGAMALGCWDGSDKELQRLRGAGFDALVLKDACVGDVARGGNLKSPSWAAQRVTNLVKMALSKGSRKWSGSMFGSVQEGDATGATNWESYFDRS